MRLKYKQPAPNSMEGWEKYSLPIGNGYAGASVFGGVDTERIQFTTNVFANDYARGGVSNFAEIHIHFPEREISNYERGLTLDDGVAYSSYQANGKHVLRRAYFSYVDKVFVYTLSGCDDFTAELIIPYLGTRSIEDGGREGQVFVENQTVVMRGSLPFRNLLFEGRMFIKTDGQAVIKDGKICVTNATESTIEFVMDTSYKLCPETFLDGNHKALGVDPHEKLVALQSTVSKFTEKELYERHKADYYSLMGRVKLNLGGKEDERSTDELLRSYQEGNKELYLEELYYAYGRHLLISSSREGTPPASLQGVWVAHDKSPWGSGFWHNINVQMNYWHAFSTNLSECFKAYADFWVAYSKQAEVNASRWIEETNPENYDDGEGACGWIVGTGVYCYDVEGKPPHTHSGPGTGGLTAKLFWDYYDFTRDEEILKKYTFPAIHGMGKFLTKTVRLYDDRYLCSFSASPEQIINGLWNEKYRVQQYHHTVGCAFDQQMIFETAKDDLCCSELLNYSDGVTALEKEQLSGYDAVQVGYSGQIKEYDEENFYGEIGEAKHRHISQLVALMPGTQITKNTPAWLDAAKETLNLRGDKSTGWALAHRLCSWARTGEGNRTYKLLGDLLKERTYPNLWDVHPPFQIDGNFGTVAGMTEMLLQSHDGCIALLPAIPDEWKNISFSGLKARGNFTVDCDYCDGVIKRCIITSVAGGRVRLRCKRTSLIKIIENNTPVDFSWEGNILCFATDVGKKYELTGFVPRKKIENVRVEIECAEWLDDCVKLKWRTISGMSYAVYRAVENAADYTTLKITENGEYCDKEFNRNKKARLTYKIVAFKDGEPDSTEIGTNVFMHPASLLEEERYKLRFKSNNINN